MTLSLFSISVIFPVILVQMLRHLLQQKLEIWYGEFWEGVCRKCQLFVNFFVAEEDRAPVWWRYVKKKLFFELLNEKLKGKWHFERIIEFEGFEEGFRCKLLNRRKVLTALSIQKSKIDVKNACNTIAGIEIHNSNSIFHQKRSTSARAIPHENFLNLFKQKKNFTENSKKRKRRLQSHIHYELEYY